MRNMRRAQREVVDEGAIRSMLDRCKVCRLALRDGEGPYIVPMSFGYRWDEKGLRIYLHCAGEGRKLDAIGLDPRVGFEMDGGYEVTASETACGYSCAYESVTGVAQARVVRDETEKCEALACLMKHQTGRDFDFTPRMAAGVCVLCLEAERLSAKRNPPT